MSFDHEGLLHSPRSTAGSSALADTVGEEALSHIPSCCGLFRRAYSSNDHFRAMTRAVYRALRFLISPVKPQVVMDAIHDAENRTSLDRRCLVRFVRLFRLPFHYTITRLCFIGATILAFLGIIFLFIGVRAQRNLSNAIIENDRSKFQSSIWEMIACAIVVGLMRGSSQYLLRYISAFSRHIITTFLQRIYLKNKRFYQLNCMQPKLDNIDQRLAKDVDVTTKMSFSLYGDLFNSLAQVFAGVITLLNSPVGWFGLLLISVWVTAAFFTIKWLARRVVPLVFSQSNLEGVFRYVHAHIRLCSEPIALQDGGKFVSERADESLSHVLSNKLAMFRKQVPLDIATGFLTAFQFGLVMIAIGIPITYQFTGEDVDASNSAETLLQLIPTLSLVISGCTAVFSKAGSICVLAGTVARVSELLEVLDAHEEDYERHAKAAGLDVGVRRNFSRTRLESDSDILHSYRRQKSTTLDGGAQMRRELAVLFDCSIYCPSLGGEKRKLVNGLNLEIDIDKCLLVVGPSGSGKTSILRVVSGLWEMQSGLLVKPRTVGKGGILVIPQRPYLFPGTLREQILYPQHPRYDPANKTADVAKNASPSVWISDTELADILHLARLDKWLEKGHDIDGNRKWVDTLSLSEQQQLNFARIFYHKPSVVLLDDATSGVSPEIEAVLYCNLRKEGIAYMSTGSRKSLKKFHHSMLVLDGQGGHKFEKIFVKENDSRENLSNRMATASVAEEFSSDSTLQQSHPFPPVSSEGLSGGEERPSESPETKEGPLTDPSAARTPRVMRIKKSVIQMVKHLSSVAAPTDKDDDESGNIFESPRPPSFHHHRSHEPLGEEEESIDVEEVVTAAGGGGVSFMQANTPRQLREHKSQQLVLVAGEVRQEMPQWEKESHALKMVPILAQTSRMSDRYRADLEEGRGLGGLTVTMFRRYVRLLGNLLTSRRQRAAWLAMLFLVVLSSALHSFISINLHSNIQAAVTQFSKQDFGNLVIMFVVACAAYSLSRAFQSFLTGVVQVDWRRQLSRRAHQAYFKSCYHLFHNTAGDYPLDSCDQRIACDIDSLSVYGTAFWWSPSNLGPVSASLPSNADNPGVIPAVVTLLFALGPSVAVTTDMSAVVFASITVAIFLNILLLRRIAQLTWTQARLEGRYRFAHAWVRQNAESIAMLGGENTEQGVLNDMLQDCVLNNLRLNRYETAVQTLAGVFDLTTLAMAGLVAGFVYFDESNRINLSKGELSLLVFNAINTAQAVIATLVNLVSYTYVAAVAAGFTNRVAELLERAEALNEIDFPESKHIVCHSLCVAPPMTKDSAEPPVLLKNMTVDCTRDKKLLIVGPVGSGKSGFIRTLSRVWPPHSGHVSRPKGNVAGGLMVLPQLTYFVSGGSMRTQLTFPASTGIHHLGSGVRTPMISKSSELRPRADQTDDTAHLTDEHLFAVLAAVGLADRVRLEPGGLDADISWQDVLSSAESQALSLARVLLHSPSIVLIDDGLCALPRARLAAAYAALHKANILFLSSGEESQLSAYHDTKLEFFADGSGRWRLVPIDHAQPATL